MRTRDTYPPYVSPGGDRLVFEGIGQGTVDEGDSGAGVHLGGRIYGVVSRGGGNLATAVPTDDIAGWIEQVSGVGPTRSPGVPLRLMPMGDSITVGVGSPSSRGYRGPLWDTLGVGVSAPPRDFVGGNRDGDVPDPDHEGFSGWRIDQVAGVAGSAVSQYRPNVVTLHIGTNDMNGNYQAATAPDRLGALIDDVLAAQPDVVVLVATLVPSGNAATQARIEEFNRRLPEVVERRQDAGEHVLAVDMSELTTADLADDLHPNERGYRKMADAFLGGIARAEDLGWVYPPAPVGQPAVCSQAPNRWLPRGRIASGVGAPASQVRFADMDGDGRDDYLVLADNGAVDAWINNGGDPSGTG